MLIGGAFISIDLEDIKKNVEYGGDFHDRHPTIRIFWQVVQDFNEKLENYNEKFTYAIQSFQATIGNISNKVNEQKDLVNITFLFTLKK